MPMRKRHWERSLAPRTPVRLGGARRSVHDELRPHVPVRDHTLGALATAAAASIAARLDREEAGRSRPLGRALDLGCGRGQYTPELARGVGGRGHRLRAGRDRGGKQRRAGRRGAQLRGRRRDAAAAGEPGDVRLLPRHRLLPGPGRRTASSKGNGVCALANPGATLLLLSFGPSRWRGWSKAHRRRRSRPPSRAGKCSAKPADTAGLGWPMNKTAPRWYRLRRQT